MQSIAAADKMSTIVMRVDLDCEKCFKKIRKVLCKIQDKVSIRTISYDEKSKTVAISGPFDAEEVADRLTSSAGKVITDMHVAGGGGNQKHVFNAPKSGKGHGHGHGGHHGGKEEKGYGGYGGLLGGGGKQDKGHGGFGGFLGGGGGGGKQEKGHGGFLGGGNKNNKQEKGHGGYGGGGGKQDKGHGGGHGGGKPDKKHVKFDFDDDMSDDDDDDMYDDEPGHHAHHHGANNGKPKIVTSTPVAARLDAPRTGPSMSMATAAGAQPMRMPGMAPQPQMQMQGMAVPSIWPAPAPEWGYSSAPQYGGYNYNNAGGGYYGVPAATSYGYGGYGGAPPAYGGAPPAYGGYGRAAPYGTPPQQYYEEEPSAGCSIM